MPARSHPRLSRCDAPAPAGHARSTDPCDAVFKHDARSRVWLASGPAHRWVVKRFEYSPLRQRLALLVGRHPAQLELRWNRRLQAAAVRVAPVVSAGWESAGAGCRVWLATPWVGESMQRRLKAKLAAGESADAPVDAAAELARDLLAAGLTFRDFKPSNVVIDGAGRGWLIDVGSVRRGRSRRAVERMLAVMDRVLARDGAGPALRARFRDRALRSAPGGAS